MKQPIIIVGAGLGGLAAAIHLAARGRNVTIVEKNERVGGKLNTITEAGYTFDTGPSLLTMPWVLDELCTIAGHTLCDHLTLIAPEPSCRYHWPDGTTLDTSHHLPQLIRALEHLAPHDTTNLLRFLAYASNIYDTVAEPFLLHPFAGLRDLITPALIRDSAKIDPLRTVHQAVTSFFTSPHLQQLFDRYATYNGSSPFRAPATFNLIAFIEITQGGWYIKGGMYQLARLLEHLARHLGVTIRTQSPVARIDIHHRTACGVILDNGEHLPAETVIINADPRYAYTTLIPNQPRQATRLATQEPSSSGFILLLGIDRDYPQLAHHTIFFSADYPREFAAIFDKRIPAADPTIYICTTARTDPHHAPPGHLNLFLLINAPALNKRVTWTREAPSYRNLVIRKLERMGLAHLSTHITYERLITPEDLQSHYNAPDGAIYGLASNHPWAAFLRPPLQARNLRQLYFVGGGTHPGGGIPLVLLSGRAVAARILSDTT